MSAPRDLGMTTTGSHPPEHPHGLVLAERFRLEGLLGMGGMGVVYRAHDTHLGVPVALKMLRPELASNPESFERFRQELLLARQVSSPHVVRIHDIAQHEGRWLISMDLIEGQSLEKIIDQRGPLPVAEAVALLRQIAEGLDAAHRGGVVHRDLKPANVLVDQAGNAFISDFGVARSLGASRLTRSGSVVGTPEYLSPEQARAEPADQRSDLYSLGLIGYEMLTGTLPFSGGTPAESALQRIAQAPPPVIRRRPDVPRWLSQLLGLLLRPSPAHRLQSARAVIEALDARSASTARRAAWLPWIAPVLLLGALAGGAYLWRGQAPAPPLADAAPRIAVLPIGSADTAVAADTPSFSDALRGLSDHLRSWIGEQHHAVLDAERTGQALALLGAESGTGAPAPERMHEVAHASVVVSGRWIGAAAAPGHIAFDVLRDGAATVTVHGAEYPREELVAAYLDAAPKLLRELGLAAQASTEPVPADPRALAAFGLGLQERSRGDPASAVQRFNEATVAAPGFISAWLALAESARAAGRAEAALTATLNGLRLVDAPGSRPALRLEALRASLEGEPGRAVSLLADLQATRPHDSQLSLLLAEAESEAGQFQRAAERLQEIAATDPDDPRVWYLLGKVSILRGEARRAVDDYLVHALVLFNRSRNAVGQADTINALGVGYERLGQVDQAIEQYARAVELRRTLRDPRGLASSLRNMAALATVRGEFDLAEERLAEARELLESLRDRQGLADLDNDLGLLAEERGDFAGALAHYREALQQRQAIGHAHGIAESLNNIGFGHYQLGAYDDASVYWRQALDSFEALGDLSGVVRSRQNLAVLDLARGEWEQAQAGLEATLAQAEREQMVEEAAVSLRYLAELALLRGRGADALARLERAETLFVGREDQRGLLDVRLLRARVAILERRFDDARALLAPPLQQRSELSPAQRVELLLVAVDAHLRSGESARARELLAAAGREAGSAGVPLHQLHARILRAAADGGEADAAAVLDEARRFGHAPLQLRAHEVALAGAVAGGPASAERALELYRSARGLLRRVGDYGHAASLHALGARVATAAGDLTAAAEASAAARTAELRMESAMSATGRRAADGDAGQ